MKKSTKPKRNLWKDPPSYGTYKGKPGDPDEWREAFNFAFHFSFNEAKEFVKEESPWTILGVEPGSSIDAIKKAFRKLMLIHHPDKGGDAETCKKILAAYVILVEGE